jgi:hypothetical protein
LNPDKIVTLLNIKATVSIISSTETNLSDTFYNNRATYAKGSTLIDA